MTCSIGGCQKSHYGRGWCEMHYQRWRKHGDPLMLAQGRTPEARFWEKVRVADVADPGACWLWAAGQDRYGYGEFRAAGKSVKAHRFSYEMLTGSVPEGLQLDHLCRVRHCVNPDHLEPVTQRENIMRGVSLQAKNAVKTHCPSGHEYSAENTRLSQGRRHCRTCQRAHQAAYRSRMSAT